MPSAFYFSLTSPLLRWEDAFGWSSHTCSGERLGGWGAKRSILHQQEPTVREGGKLAGTGTGSDLSSCPPPWLLLSSWSHHWEANTGSRRRYPEIWPAVWQYLSGTAVQNIPISAPHSSWLLEQPREGAKRKFPVEETLWDTEEQVSRPRNGAIGWPFKEGYLAENSLSTLVSLKDTYKNFNENFHKNKSTKWEELHGYISEKFSS